MKIWNLIKRLIRNKLPQAELSSEEVGYLRTSFNARYHNFKLLLNANNRALEIMSEIEEALHGSVPFGMSFVRARTTSVSTSVFQIIKHLNELAPGKYDALFDRFKDIQKEISAFLNPGELQKDGPLVFSLHDVGKDLADETGPKAANLGEIANQLHLPIPNGFVVTATSYRRFMEHNDLPSEINRRIQSASTDRMDRLYSLSAAIQQFIIQAHVPAELEEDIREYYRLLEQEEDGSITVAMRSSALCEDLKGMSFAGQYRSELNVSGENIVQAYKEIVASKYSLPAMTYRINRGIRDEDVAMCVVFMTMVDAASGGVMYSRNPVNIRDDAIVINSVWGLPKSIVDGSTPSDLFVISRSKSMKILQKDISRKGQKFICRPQEGVRCMDITGEEALMASLSDLQARELARIAILLEKYYGTPQDIEWAIRNDGSIILLQCRPLQQMDVPEEEKVKMDRGERPEPVILSGGIKVSPGVAAGPVFVGKKNMDVVQFPDGGVLVASQALPRWAPLLNRAAAAVTDKGGITGHLSTVAREYRVPALFGLKGAVDTLKNGQMVTVDADGLKIYEGRIDALLKIKKGQKDLMEGSPVYESLKSVAEHIVPLNLLDPGAPEFKPKSCKTFHDITRFCHEKSVIEMFCFGKDHRFAEHSSKQLVCDVPMQFWIINLDDGFKEEVNDKWVKLENISSIPMLSLWQGMTAVPWEGPPPVNARGFMSVLMEATANPALDPSTGFSYAVRNYFMISKNFCTLQSRFGFHFTTVEALVGKRAIENYASFQFKGGAANLKRKIFRARFVAEILDQYDFRTEVREDAAFARIEGYEQSFMEDRLRIIGYLIIHTRQLDMVMSDDAAINHHRKKIIKDLNIIVSQQQ